MKIIREGSFEYLRAQQASNIRDAKIFALIGIPVLLLGFLIGYIGFLAGTIFLAISLKFYINSTHYESGIEGESAVSEALKQLDDSYYLINDILLQGSSGNIDHVLLCPKGIFVIETKNYSGNIRIYGNKWYKKGMRKSYEISSGSHQAIANAARLGDLIRKNTDIYVFVRPICVFTGYDLKLKVVHKSSVPILQLYELVNYIREAPPSTFLTHAKIQGIVTCLAKNAIN